MNTNNNKEVKGVTYIERVVAEKDKHAVSHFPERQKFELFQRVAFVFARKDPYYDVTLRTQCSGLIVGIKVLIDKDTNGEISNSFMYDIMLSQNIGKELSPIISIKQDSIIEVESVNRYTDKKGE